MRGSLKTVNLLRINKREVPITSGRLEKIEKLISGGDTYLAPESRCRIGLFINQCQFSCDLIFINIYGTIFECPIEGGCKGGVRKISKRYYVGVGIDGK